MTAHLPYARAMTTLISSEYNFFRTTVHFETLTSFYFFFVFESILRQRSNCSTKMKHFYKLFELICVKNECIEIVSASDKPKTFQWPTLS